MLSTLCTFSKKNGQLERKGKEIKGKNAIKFAGQKKHVLEE
jgi:hypothetical protein